MWADEWSARQYGKLERRPNMKEYEKRILIDAVLAEVCRGGRRTRSGSESDTDDDQQTPPRPPWNYPAPWWNLRGPLSYPSLRLLRGAGSGGDSKQRGGQGATPGPGSGTGDPSRSASDLLDIAIALSGIHIRHVVSPLRTRALLARLRSSSIASERQISTEDSFS